MAVEEMDTQGVGRSRSRQKSQNSVRVFCFFLLLCFSFFPLSSASSSSSSCKAWLVQSTPTDMPELHRVSGVLSTGDVFRWLAGNSTTSLDIIAQYWELVPQPKNPNSGDYGFSDAEMDRLGGGEGIAVYDSLVDAADRMVDIRIVQHTGFYPDFDQESADLAAGRTNVQNLTLLHAQWWGSGIVHAKVWISDKKDLYIGSANNDWKSLTQVKEMGIYLVGCSEIARKVEVYFHNLYKLASLNSSAYTRSVWDEQWQVQRQVPCWSHFLPHKDRCRSPLPAYIDVPHVDGYPMISDPYMFHLPIETPGYSNSNTSSLLQTSSSYLSFSPPELSFGKFQTDEQGWVETIKSVSVGSKVRINTMDWLGQSQYARQTVYWSSLSTAISEIVFAKNATVRILVAYWSGFIDNTDDYLKALLYTNNLCSSSNYNNCGGKVEIKYFKVPGFEKTGAAVQQNGTRTGNIYPGYSRINHGKYAVSDVRAHIGTSNLVWDYFYTTAGVSFGTYQSSIVSQLQQVFDADWNSPYTVDVEPLLQEISSTF